MSWSLAAVGRPADVIEKLQAQIDQNIEWNHTEESILHQKAALTTIKAQIEGGYPPDAKVIVNASGHAGTTNGAHDFANSLLLSISRDHEATPEPVSSADEEPADGEAQPEEA